jgi:hypothetical protein
MRALLLFGAVLLLPFACDDGAGPTEVMRSFFVAMEVRDLNSAEDLVCQRQQEEVRQILEPFGQVTQLDEAFSLSFEDLVFEERNNDGQTAVIRVTGSVTLSFLGQEETQPVNEEHILMNENGRWVICDP